MLETGLVVVLATHLSFLITFAGAIKIAERDSFRNVLDAHRLLPMRWTIAASVGIPWAEVLVGLWLFSGFQLTNASFAAAALLGSFLVYRLILYRALKRDVPCGCVGTARETATGSRSAETASLGLNLALALLLGAVGRTSLYPEWLGAAMPGIFAVALAVVVHLRRRRLASLPAPFQALTIPVKEVLT